MRQGRSQVCRVVGLAADYHCQQPHNVLLLPQVGLFEAAARAAPGDADAHVALGVLHNLGRAYEPAVASFRCAQSPVQCCNPSLMFPPAASIDTPP